MQREVLLLRAKLYDVCQLFLLRLPALSRWSKVRRSAGACLAKFAQRNSVTDKRYKAESPVPESVLAGMQADVVHSPGFSIKGEKIEGRPAYLDFQVRTQSNETRAHKAAYSHYGRQQRRWTPEFWTQ